MGSSPLAQCTHLERTLLQANRLEDIDVSLVRRSLGKGSGWVGVGSSDESGEEEEEEGLVVRSTKIKVLRGEVACVWGRCLLAEGEFVLAQQKLREGLDKFGDENLAENRVYEMGVVLAQLHHYMGVALAQQLSQLDGKKGAWFEAGTKGDCVKEFLVSYQLCYPATPTILLRDTCLWLALLLTQHDHAHHFLSLSQQLSFTNQTFHALGKKIRSATSECVCCRSSHFVLCGGVVLFLEAKNVIGKECPLLGGSPRIPKAPL